MHLRSLTPSIALLLAFEATARHGSFTKAAGELSLSQSAVSRNVQTLESLLQASLFERIGQRIKLTPEGELYTREINAALLRIRRASMHVFGSRGRDHVLQLAVLPIFASKWLMPRLDRFYRQHPSAIIDIHARHDEFDLDMSGMDACITMGDGNWPALESFHIIDACGVVVASPDLLARNPIRRASDLRSHQLLQITSHFSLWNDCLWANGLDPRQVVLGAKFEYTEHLIQACISGLGVGLVSDIFICDELHRGVLVRPDVPGLVQPSKSYYLIDARDKSDHPTLALFKAWLKQEVSTDILGLPLA